MGYLNDNLEVQNIHSEYFRLINDFKDLTRPSIFLRYFNINVDASVFDKKTDSTFDRYDSGINYDVYDFTPAFEVNQLVNNAQERSDLIGKQFDGTFNIIIYSIDKPRFGDIVVFPYAPLSKAEVFRVKEISVAINALQSNIKYFTLGLEYASIIDIDELKLSRSLVYLLPSEKNIDQSKFKNIIANASVINTLLQQLTFDSKFELYKDTFKNILPLGPNKIIYDNLINNRYFENIKRPFGVCNYKIFQDIAINLNDTLNNQLNPISIVENKPTNLSLADYSIDSNNLIYDLTTFLPQFSILMS